MTTNHYETALHAIIEIANMHNPRSKEAGAIIRIAEQAMEHYNEPECMRGALTAYHNASNEQVDVKVKPLVWEREDDGSLTAESVFGPYAVYLDDGHGWLVILDGHDDTWAKYPEEDFGFESDAEAVAACNKDHVTRIRSALEE